MSEGGGGNLKSTTPSQREILKLWNKEQARESDFLYASFLERKMNKQGLSESLGKRSLMKPRR